ncbi:hypothetical protein BKA24_001751 [Microbacterium marinum]|uniref:Uncharacterized protein n=1 Tax=Microbacterium marinum TaxID=421115 RepID=A0A7W7FIG2_9MICO|nr:hypothetical protein [Microbacterium marinum]MBB4667042.1 hypothetical protein [Microbacterium marinum]
MSATDTVSSAPAFIRRPDLEQAAVVETLPARLLLQIREGSLNLVAEGTVRSYERAAADPTQPGVAADARISHAIPARDIIDLLGHALADKVADWRLTADATETARIEQYLAELRDVIFRAGRAAA